MRLLPAAAVQPGDRVNLRPEGEPLVATVKRVASSTPHVGSIAWDIAEREQPIIVSAALKVELLGPVP